jgi:hypothetical protein
MDGARIYSEQAQPTAMYEEEASVNTSIAGMDLDWTSPAMATSS